MARERLTKARLAQIVTMLLILIGAFSWRTVNHQNEQHFICSTNECSFPINSVDISVTSGADFIEISPAQMIDQVETNKDHKIVKNETTWRIENTQKIEVNITLTMKEGDIEHHIDWKPHHK
ncbi:hypothetical protein [Vibrio sp. SCSIO 43136]|uniref:hypothetical protein n=1 Tax=Vibrio sp. SCSIO 43136 TaxID=2819101 RepID=UPI002075622D|nr:hypothetical protein [Vibrio sp. SCSIO 43136]USD66543.1 hypothetical protein J4N39_07005 [Vibrio sp. SCSIO 43136]